MSPMHVELIAASRLDEMIEGLCEVLISTVKAGGAIGFLAPLSYQEAQNFWEQIIRPEVLADKRCLFVALKGGRAVGTVQLIWRLQPNQPHRCEIAKMMVHPDARRQGIGRALMQAALDKAASLNKTLIMLDTKTGDVAERLYRSLNFVEIGVVPNFALDPNGQSYHNTTYMFRQIQSRRRDQ